MYNKIEYKNKAIQHHNLMDSKYKKETLDSLNSSKVYRSNLFIQDDNNPTINVEFEKTGSVDVIINNNNEKFCVLNFASFKHPGGGYLNGAKAQEEMLCHESNLYNVIGNEKFNYEYKKNLSMLNHGLYDKFAIFSPNIMFHRHDIEVACDVITCAAVNYSEYSKYGSYEKNLKQMEEYIEFVLNIAKDNNCNNLILGAWGCGVFGQDAEDIAKIFKKYLDLYYFDKVIFAIPDDKNYNKFLIGFNYDRKYTKG